MKIYSFAAQPQLINTRLVKWNKNFCRSTCRCRLEWVELCKFERHFYGSRLTCCLMQMALNTKWIKWMFKRCLFSGLFPHGGKLNAPKQFSCCFMAKSRKTLSSIECAIEQISRFGAFLAICSSNKMSNRSQRPSYLYESKHRYRLARIHLRMFTQFCLHFVHLSSNVPPTTNQKLQDVIDSQLCIDFNLFFFGLLGASRSVVFVLL